LSTDSEKIAATGRMMGVDVPFLRPMEYASDSASTFDVIKHCIEYYESENISFKYVCLLQPTVPFRDIKVIKDSILRFIENKKIDSMVSVRKINHAFNPEWLFYKNENDECIYPLNKLGLQKRRQDLKDYFYRDGSIYFFKTSNIKVYNSIYGKNIIPLLLTDENNINIDTIDDWNLAEKKLGEISRIV
jgi:CMP-N-acetylneuraminic acid synthetase